MSSDVVYNSNINYRKLYAKRETGFWEELRVVSSCFCDYFVMIDEKLERPPDDEIIDIVADALYDLSEYILKHPIEYLKSGAPPLTIKRPSQYNTLEHYLEKTDATEEEKDILVNLLHEGEPTLRLYDYWCTLYSAYLIDDDGLRDDFIPEHFICRFLTNLRESGLQPCDSNTIDDIMTDFLPILSNEIWCDSPEESFLKDLLHLMREGGKKE